MTLPELSSIGQRSSHGGWASGTRFMKKNGWDAPPYRKPHALRHSYATTMLESGADLRLAKDQRRHASITITADIYGQHLGRERQVHAVETLDRAFGLVPDRHPAPRERERGLSGRLFSVGAGTYTFPSARAQEAQSPERA
jgi:Phage integrase family